MLVNISISLRNILEIDELRQVGESNIIINISTQSFLPLLCHSCFIVYNGGNAIWRCFFKAKNTLKLKQKNQVTIGTQSVKNFLIYSKNNEF